MVVPLARANNVSIMLTQFKDSPQGIRRALVGGKGLSLERLSLLLQVCCHLLLLLSLLLLLFLHTWPQPGCIAPPQLCELLLLQARFCCWGC